MKFGKHDEYLRTFPFIESGFFKISPFSSNTNKSDSLTDSFRTPLGVIKMPSSDFMHIAPPVPKE